MIYAGELPVGEQVWRWPEVRLDQFKDIGGMIIETMDLFNQMCHYAERNRKWYHRINSDYRAGDTGQHGLGKAIDSVFYKKKPGDVPLMEQVLLALRFGWTGVGFYPYWIAPGIHTDTRELTIPYRAIWWRDKDNTYHRGDEFAEKIGEVLYARV